MMILSVAPIADPDSAPYWAACGESRLVVQACLACGSRRFPATSVCDVCRSPAAEWVPLPLTAELYSWVVVHQQILPEFSEVPYVVALVEFEPRVRIPGRLHIEDTSQCQAEMRVTVVFDHWQDGVVVPAFRPAEDSVQQT